MKFGKYGPIVSLILLFPCSLSFGGDSGGEDKAKKAEFLRLVKLYQSKAKKHDAPANKFKQDRIHEIGELKYGKSLSFLDRLFREERDLGILSASLVAMGKVGTLKAAQSAFKRTMAHKSRERLFLFLVQAMQYCRNEEAAAWLVKSLLFKGKPAARLAVIESLGVMRCKAGTDGLLKCLKERDVSVVYESARSLGMIGEEKARPPLHELCRSRDWRIRAGAVFALRAYRDDESFRLLLEALSDAAWQVREFAATSLREYKRKEAVDKLLEACEDSPRRVIAEIERTLFKMGEGSAGVPKRNFPTYHGTKIVSDRVFFILDATVSMGMADRLKLAKEALLKTLAVLDRKTLCGLATFGDKPKFFTRRLVWGLPGVRSMLAKLVPFGEGGGFFALKKAIETIRDVDTICILTDSNLCGGKYDDTERILLELREMNRFHRIRIHTVAFLPGDPKRFGGWQEWRDGVKHFLKRLAKENHGEYRCVE